MSLALRKRHHGVKDHVRINVQLWHDDQGIIGQREGERRKEPIHMGRNRPDGAGKELKSPCKYKPKGGFENGNIQL